MLDGGTKDSSTPKLRALTTDASLAKAAITKVSPLDELKETMKLGDDCRRAPSEGDSKEETRVMPKNDSNSDSNTDKIRERDRERTETRDHDSRGRDSGYDGRVQDSDRDREREKDLEREREKERRHSGNDEGSGANIKVHFAV